MRGNFCAGCGTWLNYPMDHDDKPCPESEK